MQNISIPKLVWLGLLGTLAACGGDAAQTGSEPEEVAVIRQFVEAFNADDIDAAMSLMGDEVVSSDDGLLIGSDAIRASLEATPSCPIRLEKVEPSGQDLLVTIEFLERGGKTCSGHTAGSTGTLVFRVEDGKITRIP